MGKSLPVAWLGLMIAGPAGFGQEPEPAPAIRVRLDQPDEQARQAIRLFGGSKAPHPAAALAAWKRASAEPNRLGKPLEALIAALNPRMAGELESLGGAEVSIWFNPDGGQPSWCAILPNDDGTFAALATALVLSGGAAEGPMGDLAVDRLGGPGSPLMAKDPRGTLLAKSREGLERAGERLAIPPDEIFPNEGLSLSIEPGSLKGSKSLAVRRLAEVLRPPEASMRSKRGSISLNTFLSFDSLIATLGYSGPRPSELAEVPARWLDAIPADRAMVGFALTTDPAARSWDALFGLADRVEKLDPGRADVASVQIRLDLLARVVGVRAETDVLLHLRGVSGWVGSDGKVIDGALLALHLDEQAAAERLVAKVKPLPGSGPVPPIEAGQPRSLGLVDGRALRISRSDRSVVLTWGEGVLEASLQARDNPDRSAGPLLRKYWRASSNISLAGGIWPGRVPGIWPEGTPLAKALSEARPIAWHGGWRSASAYTAVLTWDDLDAVVRRFLDLLPLDPPPDR